jgi:hypothetical protein
MIKRIIDKRIKEKFMMDDAYLNGQAKICGWQATLVYTSLCRHAGISQESFPSIKLMSEELRVDRKTIIKGLRSLEKHSVIAIRKSRTKGGKWLNNTYVLLDKSGWIKTEIFSQVDDKDTVKNASVVDDIHLAKSLSSHHQVDAEDTKETHLKETNNKETHLAATPPQAINSLLDFFKNTVNPHLNFGNKSERIACANLIEAYGLEQVKQALLAVTEQRQNDKYLPVVTSPWQLWTKWAAIGQQFNRGNKKKGMMVL